MTAMPGYVPRAGFLLGFRAAALLIRALLLSHCGSGKRRQQREQQKNTGHRGPSFLTRKHRPSSISGRSWLAMPTASQAPPVSGWSTDRDNTPSTMTFHRRFSHLRMCAFTPARDTGLRRPIATAAPADTAPANRAKITANRDEASGRRPQTLRKQFNIKRLTNCSANKNTAVHRRGGGRTRTVPIGAATSCHDVPA